MNRAKRSSSKSIAPSKATSGKALAPKNPAVDTIAYDLLSRADKRQVDKLLAQLPPGAAESGKVATVHKYAELWQLPAWTAVTVLAMYGY